MSARAVGTATVSFGLVSVPVKLYSTGDTTGAISFNWIHRDCGSRLKQQYICARDGSIVEKDDMVKGYEFARDQYVLFTPDELKALEQKADNTIDIVEFVPAEKVERVFLDRAYYLGPDKGGDRAYRLLSKAMEATGLSGLGRYAARGKQYLVLLTPLEGGILLEQLKYAHEVRRFDEVPLGSGEVRDKELELAKQLIQQIATDEFHPENYSDDVRERVLQLIERKIAGEDITQAPAEAPQTQIIDLMEALKASLSKTAGQAAEPEERMPPQRAEAARPVAKRSKKKAASGE